MGYGNLKNPDEASIYVKLEVKKREFQIYLTSTPTNEHT
jgi:hypothetical protein